MTELSTEEVFGPEVKEPKPKAETPAEPEPQPEEAPEPEDTGEVEEPKEAPPPGDDAKPPKGYVPLAAIEDERRKRQEWERKYGDLERQHQQAQQQTQHLPKNFLDDPEGTLQQFQISQRVELSRTLMQSLHTDYEEKEAHFEQLARSRPELAYRLQFEPNPAKFAYDTAKEDMELADVRSAGGVSKFREKLLEELRAELQQQPPKPPVEAPPESLAAAPSTVSQKDTFKPPSTNDVFD